MPSVQKLVRSVAFWVVVALVVLLVASQLLSGGDGREKLRYDEFSTQVADGHVKSVKVYDDSSKITGTLADGTKFKTAFVTQAGDRLTDLLDRNHVAYDVSKGGQSIWISLLVQILPILLLVGIFFFFINAMQGGGSRVMQFGKAKARQVSKDQPKVTFSDVAGADEAVEELQEIKDFLESPAKFQAIGAKIPKGVLLFGPPGTGKTLLARAVAGEAGVPFFSISGSDFVEMFVGVGASRVRDLFEQAKQNSPAIIFVDEIDAVGRHRGAGLGGGHDEREQTLNQLLVEMDGFDPSVGVILMAATNRPEILDPALLRAGRFDRHVLVDRPDKLGRLAILKLHARNVPLSTDADLEKLAAMTAGFVGADLANLVNEAALLAVRRGKDSVGTAELSEAVERVIAGLEKKNRVLNKMEKERVAHHEIGHALVALALPGTDPVEKISIIPRGIAALGYTLQLPTEDRFLMTRSELGAKIAVLLGGRVAEELVYGEISTGAQDDLVKATNIARAMVRSYGMSDALGVQSFESERRPLFLDAGVESRPDASEETLRAIDGEVRRILDEQHRRVKALLEPRRRLLHDGAELLLAKETLGGDELRALAADSIRAVS